MKKFVIILALLAATPVLAQVDLGLSVLWETSNVGTDDTDAPGRYFRFGELSDLDNVPSKELWSELMDNCTWKWERHGEMGGYLVTSKVKGFEKNSIFLPAIGLIDDENDFDMGLGWCGDYWTATPGDIPQEAYIFHFEHNVREWTQEELNKRMVVRPVRPLSDNAIKKLKLDRHSMTLAPGEYAVLTVRANKNRVVDGICCWSTSNDVATVDESGCVHAHKAGTCEIVASVGEVTDKCTITVTAGGFESVDLGLPVRWAVMNVGAGSPQESGYYFAWGETRPKDFYGSGNYRWGNSEEDYKYAYFGQTGDWTNNIMERSDDAAAATWGTEWRFPSRFEMELLKTCVCTPDTVEGVSGVRVTSNVPGFEGNSIFIPAAGKLDGNEPVGRGEECYFWTDERNGHFAYQFEYFPGDSERYTPYQGSVPSVGLPVRAVTGLYAEDVSSISLDATTLKLVEGGMKALRGAMKPERMCSNSIFQWSSSDVSVATVDQDGVITALKSGSCEIICRFKDKEAICEVTVSLQTMKALDLGLSVLWSDVNVGATVPSDCGTYFFTGQPPLCTDGWRLPTVAEYQELMFSCTRQDDTIQGMRVMLFTSQIPGYPSDTLIVPYGGLISNDNYFIGDFLGGPLAANGLGWNAVYLTSDPIHAFDFKDIGAGGRTRDDLLFPVRLVRDISDTERAGQLFIVPQSGVSTIGPGENMILKGVYQPGNISVDMEWKSSDPRVAVVEDGRVIGVKKGKCVITASYHGISAQYPITVNEASYPYVDLGLSVMWSTVNLGADRPEERGFEYNWAEVVPSTSSSYEAYRYSGKVPDDWGWYASKYAMGTQDNNGFSDNKYLLDPEDDAATWNMGSIWHTPSKEEFFELVNDCDWTEETIGAVHGWRVTGRREGYTDKSIFLPDGGYFSNTLDVGHSDSWYVHTLYVLEFGDDFEDNVMISLSSRYSGNLIRPVRK